MYFNLFRSALIASALAVAVPAAADSLGFRYADLTFGAAGAASGPFGQVRISTDVAITGAHGLQLDLGVIGYPGEFLGQIDAHLYLMPANRAKYGVISVWPMLRGARRRLHRSGLRPCLRCLPTPRCTAVQELEWRCRVIWIS